MRLPDPHPLYGFFVLKDHSRVYPSGAFRGEWFAWLCTGCEVNDEGREIRTGEVLLNRASVRYFDRPEAAARALMTAARLRSQKKGAS